MAPPQYFSNVQFAPSAASGGPGALGLEVKRRDRAPGGAALVPGEAVYLTQWMFDSNGDFLEIGTAFHSSRWFFFAGRLDSRGFAYLAQVEIPRDPNRLLEHRFRIEQVNAYYNGEWRFTIDGQQLATYYWPVTPYAFACGLEMYRNVPHAIKVAFSPKWRPAGAAVGSFRKLTLNGTNGNGLPHNFVRTPPLCGRWDPSKNTWTAADVKSCS